MKSLIYLLFAASLILASCDEDTQRTEEKVESTAEKVAEKIPAPDWITYNSISEILLDACDYSESSGCLKLISDNEVEVSQWIFDGDIESTITDGVKRDIVYVVFQIFANSEINEVTVTSIPLLMKSDMQTQDKYLNEYKKTVTVTREKATEMLKTFANTKDFRELYEASGSVWVPSKKFRKMKFEQLDLVFKAF